MNDILDIDGTLLDDKSATTSMGLAIIRAFSQRPKLDEPNFVSLRVDVLQSHFARFAQSKISFQQHRCGRIHEIFSDETLSDSETDARYKVHLDQYESC
jgi:hypothetical protein